MGNWYPGKIDNCYESLDLEGRGSLSDAVYGNHK